MTEQNFTTKEMLVSLMKDVREVRDCQIRHDDKLKTIEKHAQNTNGKIAQAILDIAETKETIHTEDARYFAKTIKYGGTTLLCASFLFIKESRDLVISFLKLFV